MIGSARTRDRTLRAPASHRENASGEVAPLPAYLRELQ